MRDSALAHVARKAGASVVAIACVVSFCVAAAVISRAQTAKPKVPAGTDPGGIAIALLGSGIDYTKPDVASRLARDGEGEIIALDLIDGDNRPYAPAATAANAADPESGTALTRLMLSAYARSRLVPVRVPAGDAASYAQAIAFIVRTPARIVAVPFAHERTQWDILRRAARTEHEILFVVAAERADTVARAGDNALPDNVVVVAPASHARMASVVIRALVDVWVAPRGSKMLRPRPGSPPTRASEAVALAAALAACTQHRDPASGGAAAKAKVLALASPAQDDPGVRIVDPQCLYGGRRL